MSFLTRTSLMNRLIVGLITLAIAVLGIFSMNSLKQELMPSMQVPMAMVSVQSPGLAPEELSRLVTEPTEQAVGAVPGITKVSSTTSAGDATVMVEWPFDGDKETLAKLRSAAEALKPTFPQGTEITVFSGGADDMPAMMLSAASEDDPGTLGDALNQTVIPALQGVPGVQKVTLEGREELRIMIDLRPADVTRLKVDPTQIPGVLEAHGAALPAGEAEAPEGALAVTVGGALTSVEEVAALPIAVENGVVKLSDFADVKTEAQPTESISRVNGNPALTLQVKPGQGANVIDISHGVNEELDRLAPTINAEFITIFDQAPFIEQSIEDLSVEGGLGLLFAVLVILAFLGSWRSTIIAAISIPLSLLITLTGLLWSGNTLNILTLGALTIAIGRVVDDSIVVIENITRRKGAGHLTIEGVVASVKQVAGAITASTLTTVAVFLPIAFVSGIAGQLFRPFAITVSIALIASLVVALTIVPVLAYWFIRGKERRGAPSAPNAEAAATPGGSAVLASSHPAGTADAVHTSELAQPTPGDDTVELARPVPATSAVSAVSDGPVTGSTPAAGTVRIQDGGEHSDLDEIHTAPDRLQRAIMPALNATRRHPVITLVTSALILVGTLGMTSMLQTDFLGSSGNESLQLTQSPKETTADELVAVAEPVEAALGKVPGVRDVITNIPVSVAGAPSTISYDVQLEENADVETVNAAVQKALDGLTDAEEIQILTQDAFVDAGGSGIALQIRGNDPAALREASDLLEKQLADESGVQSVKSELAGEQPIVRVKLNELQAANIGFSPATVAQAVQEALEGKNVGRIMLEGRDRDIIVRTPGTERTAEQLGEILLPVTPVQTAQAQKIAADALKAKGEEEAAEAERKQDAELAQQINDAVAQRAEMAAQVGPLNEQLAQLSAAPIVAGPPLSPEDDAMARAVQERMEQLAALQGAIASAQGGVEGIDEQITSLRDMQNQTAEGRAKAAEAEAEQKAAAEITGSAIPLSAIAEVKQELTAPVITRADGERQVALTVTPEKGQLEAATAAIDRAIATTELPAGVSFELGGASAQQDDAFGQLGLAMLAAIALVLLVMVATFRSFRGPFVLLVSIPFAATGAILGLLLTNTPLGLPALIGLLMLIGIVVTNAIVLMDLVNRLRSAGADLDEAVEHGTRLRLRPILMTAAATIFALVPMSLGLTGGGVFISKPLAIVVIGGLISSTLLTLILVPILYTLVERRREKKLAKRATRRERREERRAERAETRETQRQLAGKGEARTPKPKRDPKPPREPKPKRKSKRGEPEPPTEFTELA
ncbi:HAE1 family hydrophobic/amphiphilic exporter-1 [Leucobacter luti]|uniref:HAE1 family hydrophobic/amphiphilic exporter-1 n=1 Tax=Leucobacter luti TaxID=340320 RepID=A0A4R6S3P2_9MICO|nr:efflux RND transporter permease subunit [Leucobacter luti]TDP93326.1 HAE1 family hydrophobic/amphiphilic exporter-1 [Leucobacter luti]